MFDNKTYQREWTRKRRGILPENYRFGVVKPVGYIKPSRRQILQDRRCIRCGAEVRKRADKKVVQLYCTKKCSVAAALEQRVYIREPVAQRVEKYILCLVDVPCQFWVGPKDGDGYGHLMLPDGGHIRVHRWIYENNYGPLPNGFVPDHTCQNRYCQNPHHFEAVTLGENTRRARWKRPLGIIDL